MDDLLTNLHDIQAAPAPSWWPPAPGWWLLGLTLAVLVLSAAPRVWRSLGRRRRLRRALGALGRLHEGYLAGGDGRLFCAEVSALLRRAALARYPRRQVAGLGAEAWLEFLKRTDPGGDFGRPAARALIDVAYRPAGGAGAGLDHEALLNAARHWLRHNL